jgi:hypothetical protein
MPIIALADTDLHQGGLALPNELPEVCPKCGQHLDAHDRGVVDFYCPEPEASRNGD